MSYLLEGRSKHEGKVAVSLSVLLPGGVNHAWWERSTGARRQRKRPDSSLLGLASHWLNDPWVLLFFVPKKVCLHFGFWHPDLVRRKKPSPPEPPLRVGGVLSSLSQRSSLITPGFFAV
jgi:hypothetical protein